MQVTRDGKYIPPPPANQKAMYSTMLFIRADIVKHSARFLARATTIAVRYCCVRRQTAPAPTERELQVGVSGSLLIPSCQRFCLAAVICRDCPE
jgi:acyl-CoA oxidase